MAEAVKAGWRRLGVTPGSSAIRRLIRFHREGSLLPRSGPGVVVSTATQTVGIPVTP